MKRKLLGAMWFLLAAASLGGGAQAGSSGIAGGAVLALVFIFLGLKSFGVIKSKEKKTNEGPVVWTTAGSDKYHRRPGCQHITGKETIRLYKTQAREKGFKPCKTCYPRGDRD